MEREPNKHIEEERLEAYAANSLAEEESAPIEEHLLFCKACQDRLHSVERYAQAMRSAAMRLREEEKDAPAASGAWYRLRELPRIPMPVWCGALAAAALLLVMVHLPPNQPAGAPIDVELQAIRGESTGTALTGHALRLHLDNQGVRNLPDWHIEIVDSEGSRVWAGTGAWSDTAITANVPKSLTPGTYYVRLLHETPDPVREYQLVIK